jgi:hypothetical protein
MMPRMWTPEKERVGIEVYTLLTDNENGFWFFEDFIHRLRLNHKRIERILEKCLPISNRFAAKLERISNRDLEHGQQFRFIPRCASLMGDRFSLPRTLPSWFSNPPEELWAKLALGVRGSEAEFPLRYWVEVPEWEDSANGSGRVKGIVRKYQSPMILRHIPLAYYIAQEIWYRRDDNAREVSTRILDMISKDLKWCAATVDEMDVWWDSVWSQCKRVDKPPSVTKLRHG